MVLLELLGFVYVIDIQIQSIAYQQTSEKNSNSILMNRSKEPQNIYDMYFYKVLGYENSLSQFHSTKGITLLISP